MKKKISILFVFTIMTVLGFQAFAETKGDESIMFFPVSHASFAVQAGNDWIYIDPVGDQESFKNYGRPSIILITHSHPDHLNAELVNKLKKENTKIFGPAEVIKILGFGEIINNNENKSAGQIKIAAIPAYNLTEDRLKFHPKGIGNGYLLDVDGKRIYISGDTEDIPEMRALKNIDFAFVCMNLPYTMTVDQAISGVRAFNPKVVFPYHYRSKNGFTDIIKFSELVSDGKDIKVSFLKWY